MEIKSADDFALARKYTSNLRKRFPMFGKDIRQIEDIIERHIQEHATCFVYYRQTKRKSWLEKADKEIEKINVVLQTVGKIELMALLAR
jgi:hypothetical protein